MMEKIATREVELFLEQVDRTYNERTGSDRYRLTYKTRQGPAQVEMTLNTPATIDHPILGSSMVFSVPEYPIELSFRSHY